MPWAPCLLPSPRPRPSFSAVSATARKHTYSELRGHKSFIMMPTTTIFSSRLETKCVLRRLPGQSSGSKLKPPYGGYRGPFLILERLSPEALSFSCHRPMPVMMSFMCPSSSRSAPGISPCKHAKRRFAGSQFAIHKAIPPIRS